MGKDIYVHLHHFCTGLLYMNRFRSNSTSKHSRNYAQTAIKNFDYVLTNWPKDYALTVEARNNKSLLEFQISHMKMK